MKRTVMAGAVAVLLGGILGCPPGSGSGMGLDNGEDTTAHGVSAAPGFNAATRMGTTIGEREAEVCDGWFPNEANHTLTVVDGLGMTIRVEAIDELRLWILCGESHFCGEDADGVTQFSRFWNRGDCEVYIGTTNQGQDLDYTTEFVED